MAAIWTFLGRSLPSKSLLVAATSSPMFFIMYVALFPLPFWTAWSPWEVFLPKNFLQCALFSYMLSRWNYPMSFENILRLLVLVCDNMNIQNQHRMIFGFSIVWSFSLPLAIVLLIDQPVFHPSLQYRSFWIFLFSKSGPFQFILN